MLTRLFCRFDAIAKVFADGGHTGTLIEWAKEMFGYSIEIVSPMSSWTRLWLKRSSGGEVKNVSVLVGDEAVRKK